MTFSTSQLIKLSNLISRTQKAANYTGKKILGALLRYKHFYFILHHVAEGKNSAWVHSIPLSLARTQNTWLQHSMSHHSSDTSKKWRKLIKGNLHR